MCHYTTLWIRSKLLLSVCCAHERLSGSLSWFRSACRSWALQNWSLLIQEQRWMAPTTVTCSCHSSCCQWCWHISWFLHLSKGQRSCTRAYDTVRLLELATPALFHRICGRQTVPTSIQLTTRYGALSSSECISHGCTTLMNSSSVWCTFGTASTRSSLTMQLTSGVAVFVLVCERRVDTFNKCCDNIVTKCP